MFIQIWCNGFGNGNLICTGIGIGIVFVRDMIVSWRLEEGFGRALGGSRCSGRSPGASGRLQEGIRYPRHGQTSIFILKASICLTNAKTRVTCLMMIIK
jgi:hypothetical protein